MAARKPREWTRTKMKGEDDLPNDPEFHQAVAEMAAEFRNNKRQWGEAQRKEAQQVQDYEQHVRRNAFHSGYRLMRRRRNQYWLVYDKPMTLDEIEVWINSGLGDG